MSIAVLYICTGKYDVFWSDFYTSSEEHFCNSEEKHYFVFTDSINIIDAHNVTVVCQDNLGWPFNTMYRYRNFLRIKDKLLDFDKVVFFNGNSLFIKDIKYEDFFGDNKDIVACIHPGFFNKPKESYTYENRVKSLAFISSKYFYVQGAINGGSSHVFMEVCEELANNIDNDLENGIVAVWHDESHWNAYLNNNYELIKDMLHVLSPSYLYPEGWSIPFEPKIILRDKSKHGGHESLRGIKSDKPNILSKVKNKLRALLCK